MTVRTTVRAERGDLTTLRQEAQRRGVSLAGLVSELLAEKAAGLRAQRRPQFGLFRSRSGPALSQRSVDDESSPAIR